MGKKLVTTVANTSIKQVKDKISVLLDPELQAMLQREVDRIERMSGVRAPITQVAAHVMRRGFQAQT